MNSATTDATIAPHPRSSSSSPDSASPIIGHDAVIKDELDEYDDVYAKQMAYTRRLHDCVQDSVRVHTSAQLSSMPLEANEAVPGNNNNNSSSSTTTTSSPSSGDGSINNNNNNNTIANCSDDNRSGKGGASSSHVGSSHDDDDNNKDAGRQEKPSPGPPLLMEELDSELLEIVKLYYQRKHHRGPLLAPEGTSTSTGAAPQPVPGEPHHPPVSLPLNSQRQENALHHPYTHGSPSGLPSVLQPSPTSSPAGVGAATPPNNISTINASVPYMRLDGRPLAAASSSAEDSPHLSMRRRTLPASNSVTRQQQQQQPHYDHHLRTPSLSTADHHNNNNNNNNNNNYNFGTTRMAANDIGTRLPSYSSTSFVRAYVSEVNLNMEPAIIVSGLAAALNIMVVYFLQNHVLDTRDHLGLFLIGSYLVFSSYYMIYYFLERFSSSFRRISSQDKKFYIIGNLLKAGILVSITPFACYHLVKIIVFDDWEGNILRNLGCIYSIPDFISMIIVKRMRWSTWCHHLVVVIFNYFSILNDYTQENICRCVVVYAAFSSFAYCVNVLLASRFLGVSVRVARVLSFVALVVYVLCCAINWAWQVYYLRRLIAKGHDHWTVYVYMMLICLVMWDDIVLNRWLLNHARNTAFAAASHQMSLNQRRQHHQR